MRTILATLVAFVTLAAVVVAIGCRTQPYDHPITDDFGTRPATAADLSSPITSPLDLTAPNGTGCAALLACINNCNSQQCQTDCYNNASSDAQQALNTALSCIYDFCLTSDGKRGPRCVQDDQGNFVDATDGGLGECDRCLTNAYASLGGYSCMPKNDPDCNPPSCQGAVAQCTMQ